MKIASYKGDPAVLAADLVNTRGSVSGTDFMTDVPTLRLFLEGHGISPPQELSRGDLEHIARTRDRLKEVFFAPDASASADILNSILADEGATPRLQGDGDGFRIEHASRDHGIARYVAITAAMGLAHMVVASGRSRFGVCSADDCRDVFVDTSRNKSRRYCTDSCSSRSNVAAFRARRRSS